MVQDRSNPFGKAVLSVAYFRPSIVNDLNTVDGARAVSGVEYLKVS